MRKSYMPDQLQQEAVALGKDLGPGKGDRLAGAARFHFRYPMTPQQLEKLAEQDPYGVGGTIQEIRRRLRMATGN